MDCIKQHNTPDRNWVGGVAFGRLSETQWLPCSLVSVCRAKYLSVLMRQSHFHSFSMSEVFHWGRQFHSEPLPQYNVYLTQQKVQKCVVSLPLISIGHQGYVAWLKLIYLLCFSVAGMFNTASPVGGSTQGNNNARSSQQPETGGIITLTPNKQRTKGKKKFSCTILW